MDLTCVRTDQTWRVCSFNGFSVNKLQKICSSINIQETDDHRITLKFTPEKSVTLITIGDTPIIAKSQRYQSLSSQLKATLRTLPGQTLTTTHAIREMTNTRLAYELGLPVSQPLGYARQQIYGVIKQELLFTTACPDGVPLSLLLKKKSSNLDGMSEDLKRSFHLAIRMLRAGYVHLDLHSYNILLSASGPENDLIIDHEFGGTFPDKKLEEVAAFVFGYLYRCRVQDHFPFNNYRSLVLDAVKPLLEESQHSLSVFPSRFEYAATTRIPKRERHKYLKIKKLPLENLRPKGN